MFTCLGPAKQLDSHATMAPIKDETVGALRDLVNKLESRVEQLEAKLQQAEGGPLARKSKGNTEGVRMILIGAPGAGKISLNLSRMTRTDPT